MGTRHLIAVVEDDEPRVAQYGQWDGYPTGQGVRVLDFCRKNLGAVEGRERFRIKLKACRWVQSGETKAFAESIGITDGWANPAQVEKFDDQYPFMSRDLGSEILSCVLNKDCEIVLANEMDFGLDSLFCEYAYVIDLTNARLEAYVGFQEALPPENRFVRIYYGNPSSLPHLGYFPVALVESWDLNQLPSNEAFVETIDAFKAKQNS